MRNPNALSTAGQLRARTPTFSVVLAYHQFADGIRAKEFFDSLVFKHGELFHFICHLWRFDVLREPQLFEAATRDALGADMIVLASRQSPGLSVEARRWIAHWLPSKQAGFETLVLFLDGQPRQAGDTTIMCGTLEQRGGRRQWITWPVDSHSAVQITKPGSGGTVELINALVKRVLRCFRWNSELGEAEFASHEIEHGDHVSG